MMEIFDIKNACNRYLLLWAIPQFYGFFFPASSAMALLFSIPLLLMTMYYAFITVKKHRMPSSLIILFFFFLFLSLYGLIDLVAHKEYGFLMAITNSILPIFVFYGFFCRGLASTKLLKTWFWVFLAYALLSFFKHRIAVLAVYTKDIEASEIVNNMAYILIGLFPFVFLFKNKYIQFAIISVISYFTIIGLKRGAIVILAISLFWYGLSFFLTKNKRGFWSIISVGVLVLIVYFIVSNQFATNYAVVNRFEKTLDGDSSYRDEIYSYFWNYYKHEAPVFNRIFGGGAWYTEDLIHLKAHNDWLEILIDFGIVGCVFYLIFWIGLWMDIKRINKNSICYLVGMACLISGLFRTPFSMFFYSIHIFISIMIAYSLSWYNENVFSSNKTIQSI